MTTYPFNFDQDAALAAVLYVVKRVQGVTKHKLSKILYFADKAHLERYGRLITGDQYVAMDNGPVPGRVYDMVNQADPRRSSASLFADPIQEALSIKWYANNRPIISSLKEPDLDALSESDLLCLDQAIKDYGHVARHKDLSDLSHDAAWTATERNQRMRIEAIISTFEEPELLLEHLKDPNP
ncbi:Panacea domain-containing protein [Deinococcus radiomollis]|uniref:Panacea domain-containing protein n=1 Tax=Deinococcus radiomollis TaxID=468916 RepID=UPI003891DFC5